MTKENKVHIYSFFDFSRKYVLLLPIPIIPQILIGMNLLSSSTWVLSIILVLAFLKYRNISYKISPNEIIIKRNIIIKRESHIPLRNVTLVKFNQSIIKKILGIVKVDIKTNAGNEKKVDESLIISQKFANTILESIFPVEKETCIYKANKIQVIKKALIGSNPLTGLLILIPIINGTGKIFGSEIKKKLYYGEDFKSTLIDIGIPSTIAWVTYILLTSWIISVVAIYVKYYNYTISRTSSTTIYRYNTCIFFYRTCNQDKEIN